MIHGTVAFHEPPCLSEQQVWIALAIFPSKERVLRGKWKWVCPAAAWGVAPKGIHPPADQIGSSAERCNAKIGHSSTRTQIYRGPIQKKKKESYNNYRHCYRHLDYL